MSIETEDIFAIDVNSTIGSGKSTNYKIPEDVYDAVCIGIANMGEVEVEWQGVAKRQTKIQIAFALDHKFDNGETAVITQRYTLSFGENSNLKKALTKWKVPCKVLSDILGKSARISVVHNGDYANIDSILPPKNKMDVPAVYLPSYWYTNGWSMGKAEGVLEGQRPKAEKTEAKVEQKPTKTTKAVKPVAKPAPVESNDTDELPF